MKAASQAIDREGITVNGLPIQGREIGIVEWYRANVVRGPNSFLVPAGTPEDFGAALLSKLVAEIA